MAHCLPKRPLSKSLGFAEHTVRATDAQFCHLKASIDNTWGFPCSSVSKESVCSTGDPGSIPGLGRSPGEGMTTYSSILTWKIPWTEKPGGLESQRVGHE